MTDRYSEMEMTKIARAEFKRGKTTRNQEILDIIDKMTVWGVRGEFETIAKKELIKRIMELK